MESDVYKMLQDYEKPISEPKQSGSFRYLQGMLEAGENGKEVVTHHVSQQVPYTSPGPGLWHCDAVELEPSFSASVPCSWPCTHQVAVESLTSCFFHC